MRLQKLISLNLSILSKLFKNYIKKLIVNFLDFVHQSWMAFERYPSSWEAKESSEIDFSEKEVPTAKNNYSLCKVRIHIFSNIRKTTLKRLLLRFLMLSTSIKWQQYTGIQHSFLALYLQNVSFASPFYAPPVVITTVLNGGSNKANIACPMKGPLSSWLEVHCNHLIHGILISLKAQTRFCLVLNLWTAKQ